MAMGPERSKPPLHNFTLPCGLKWGNRRFLRRVKVDSIGEISAVHRRSYGSSGPSAKKMVGRSEAALVHRRASYERAQKSGLKFRPDVENGIAAVRKKLLFDLQQAADKMKDAIFGDGFEENERRQMAEETEQSPALCSTTVSQVPPSETFAAADGSSKPWNLRTRRAACMARIGYAADAGGSSRSFNAGVKKPSVSPPRTGNKSPRLRNGTAAPVTTIAAAGVFSAGEKRDITKLSVALSRREIEEDYVVILGRRPPRRPKKRAKLVQNNLDMLFPGLWLSEITADSYKVPDDQSI